MLLSANSIRELIRTAQHNRKVLIDYLISQKEVPHWNTFLLGIPDLRKKYWRSLVDLHMELVPSHISSQDLYGKLWELFKEVTVNASDYQTRERLNQRLSEFSELVKKPLMTFDIIYEIKNFEIGANRFVFRNVEIFKLTSEDLQSLGLDANESVMQDRIFKEWVDRSVAKVEVNVSEISRAYESGLNTVTSILDVIRLVAVRERIGGLDDSMFLWELGESITIPKVRPEKGTLFQTTYHLGFRPLIVPMNEIIHNGLANQSIWQYILDGNLPTDIDTRVMRAIRWITHAVTANSLDYKLVDLCTALEILLLPNHKSGTKGELISLRQVLIGRGSSYVPEAILSLYEQRSDIIHSGTLDIISFLHYWHLLICCLDVIRNIVNLSRQNPSIEKLEDLIGIVETTESLQRFIRHCDIGIYNGQGISDIRKAAEEQLTEIEKHKQRD